MKRKLIVLAAALLAVLLLADLTGGSLAQPEAGEDRFAGLFLVYDAAGSGRHPFNDNPNLTAAGSQTLDTEYGVFSIPRNILVGQKTGDGQYIFPGVDGLCLFLIHGEMDDGSPYTEVVSDMSDCENHVTHTDTETLYECSGTAYLGPPLDAGPDWDQYDLGVLNYYRVYEAPDGTVYLDGGGNSSSGLCTYWEDHTSSTTGGSEASSETIKVTVHVEYAPRLEKLTVSQFDGNNALLQSDELALRYDMPEVACLPETAWVLVEEQSADGTARSLYNAPREGGEPSAVHTVVLLDDDGFGRTAALNIRFSAGQE